MKKFFGILVAGMMMSSCGLIDDLIGDEEEGSSDEPVATDSIAEMPEPGMDNAYRWIVERIEGGWYSETDNGERREGTAVYEFSYDEYEIINKNNLEVMAKSKEEPQIYRDSIIICSEENQDKCYYYNGEGLELVDDCINFASFEKNVYSTNYLLSGIDDSVYAKMGIIYEDDR